jgi:hypothetical protein
MPKVHGAGILREMLLSFVFIDFQNKNVSSESRSKCAGGDLTPRSDHHHQSLITNFGPDRLSIMFTELHPLEMDG